MSVGKKREPWRRYKTKEPREELAIVYMCFADKRMFKPEFADMPKGMQELFRGDERIDLPCQGGGAVGPWCVECVFGEQTE
jgi:hypothetical protein